MPAFFHERIHLKHFYLTFLTIALYAFFTFAQPATHRHAEWNLDHPAPETTKSTIFPHSGGTGSFWVTTSISATHALTFTNVTITAQSSSIATNGSQTVKVEYAVASTTSPYIASITIHVTGFAPTTLPIRVAGKGGISSAASFSPGKLAHGAMATFWGASLGTVTSATTLPLPTTLNGTSIYLQKFSTDEWKPCELLYVSPSQVNFVLPNSDQYGLHIVYSENASGELYSEFAAIGTLAPDIFTVNSTGNPYDHAAFTVQRNTNGVATYSNPQITRNQDGQWIAEPIAIEGETYLLLYATGARKDVSLAASYAILNDTTRLPLVYAGAQGHFVGLDQIAIKLDKATFPSGTHKLQVVLNGYLSNPVRIPIK